MDIKLIKETIKNKKPVILDIIYESAVIVPIIKVDGDYHILFQVRSFSLNTQPGEICFPGGRLEDNEDAFSCAIRETSEELNISKDNIEILGELDYLVTPFNMAIYSFCGILNDVQFNSIEYNKDEVSSIFSVPIKELLKQEPQVSNMTIHTEPIDNFPFQLVQNGKAYDWKSGIYPVYFYKYKDHTIWGITAKILKGFLDTLK
ncbi:CoA pyrophosphatase [Alkaliphilus sp. MSJ-5]|uniref:CoA pyrophosphatase n=1 Tax=Alkaliphilus flagellatus TaxID=2841507 RepID=A0ABS6G0T6_9FIRM|nr:CoA pyrophosphatase [Alkaliphilus flagellatus]MBU5675746.1 CoA pyrophosphatase [Alkaliphilus flagellatus]